MGDSSLESQVELTETWLHDKIRYSRLGMWRDYGSGLGAVLKIYAAEYQPVEKRQR